MPTTRTEPRTPYEVRIRTMLWIRRKIPRDFKRVYDELWQDETFRDAAMAMERLDSAEHADMPQREKVAAMMRHGRIMCARVRERNETHGETSPGPESDV